MKKHIVLLIFLVVALFSCTKTIEIVPEFENAKYSGIVKCINEFGKQVDNSGVLISIEGMEHIKTTSNDTGFFKLTVPIGTYSIIYEKEGFGNYVHDRFNFIGGFIPVLYLDARLCAPVNVNLIDYNIAYNELNDDIQCSGIAKCNSPFSIKMAIKYDLNSDDISYIGYWGVENDLNKEHEFRYSLERNLVSNKTVYVALCSQNYYDWGYSYSNSYYSFGWNTNYGSANRLTDFVKIEIP